MRTPRPGIFQIGKVTDEGDVVRVHGWGLGLCMSRCSCHRMTAGQIALAEGVDGTLGLVSTRPGCTCCEPWSPFELAAIVADLETIQNVPEVPA